MSRGKQPRVMDLEHGEIDFNAPSPVTCDECNGRIRKEIVTVRTTVSGGTYMDTVVMCDCMAIGPTVKADMKYGADPPVAWVSEDE